MIVGITGPICAGKGKTAEFFREKGFVHHSFSAEIRAVAKERRIEVNRPNLTKLGADLRKEGGEESILAARVLEKIEKDIAAGKKKFVIDGIRDDDEVNMFRKHELEGKSKRFVLIGVDAPQKMRWERMKARGRQGEPESFAEFKKTDDAEFKGNVGQEVGKCMKMADYTIDNSGTLEELQEKVKAISKEIL